MDEIKEGLAALKEDQASLYTLEDLFPDWLKRRKHSELPASYPERGRPAYS
jgi:hypothetical protein